jgi:hypothetical protein
MDLVSDRWVRCSAVVAALGSARAHSAPLPHLPIDSPHRPRPICYDPTRASRPWRLGLAAPPPSSSSPSSSSPPPPASKVTTAFAIRDPIPISPSRSPAVVRCQLGISLDLCECHGGAALDLRDFPIRDGETGSDRSAWGYAAADWDLGRVYED